MGDDVFPDRNMDHLDKLAWVIEDQGWVAVPVEAQEGPPPRAGYTYTVGFTTTFGRPEVAIFGLRAVAARGLLGLIADQYEGGVDLPVDAVFLGLLENDLPCALLPIDVDEHGDLFPDAAALLGGAAAGWQVLQFVWPDRNGRFPWDQDYDQRLRVAQPVVGRTGT